MGPPQASGQTHHIASLSIIHWEETFSLIPGWSQLASILNLDLTLPTCQTKNKIASHVLRAIAQIATRK